jgi:hypothetical protein
MRPATRTSEFRSHNQAAQEESYCNESILRGVCATRRELFLFLPHLGHSLRPFENEQQL